MPVKINNPFIMPKEHEINQQVICSVGRASFGNLSDELDKQRIELCMLTDYCNELRKHLMEVFTSTLSNNLGEIIKTAKELQFMNCSIRDTTIRFYSGDYLFVTSENGEVEWLSQSLLVTPNLVAYSMTTVFTTVTKEKLSRVSDDTVMSVALPVIKYVEELPSKLSNVPFSKRDEVSNFLNERLMVHLEPNLSTEEDSKRVELRDLTTRALAGLIESCRGVALPEDNKPWAITYVNRPYHKCGNLTVLYTRDTLTVLTHTQLGSFTMIVDFAILPGHSDAVSILMSTNNPVFEVGEPVIYC